MLRYFTAIFTAVVLLLSASVLSAKPQDIVKMNTDIEITKDMVVNDVVAVGGDITVSGRVENNAVAVGGSIILKPNAYVGGEVVAVGGNVVKDQTAIIGEKVTQIYMPPFIPSLTGWLKGQWVALWATISILALLGFLGLAVLLTAMLPEYIGIFVAALERSFVQMLLWGLLWGILVIPITVLLAVSIIGIILIPVAIVIAALAMIIGYVASAIFVGKRVLASFKKIKLPFADLILGIIILSLIGFVPVLGQFVKMAFLLAGFGAVLTTRFGTIK